MERVGFRLMVRKDRLDEYVAYHQAVWPEMLLALSQTGWCNYSLFLDRSDGSLFGYFETPDLQAALKGMADKDVNHRWQTMMNEFFGPIDGHEHNGDFLKLSNIFYLA